MRIESVDGNYSMGFIFIICITQSVISMANCMINKDNKQMQDDDTLAQWGIITGDFIYCT